MGRPSKLTDAQLHEAEQRLLAGESRRAVADSLGVSETALRKRFGSRIEQIKTVANQIVANERALQALPISSQINAANLASKLRAISDNLASAAHHGAATAHRLNALANAEVSRVDDADPMASLDNLRNVGVLTKLANDSSHIALNLLAANKETIKKMDEPPPDELPPARPQISRDEWLKEHGLN
jgi:AcrR family transcriptional regulator